MEIKTNTTKEIYNSVIKTCAASDEFKPLMQKIWIRPESLAKELRRISNLDSPLAKDQQLMDLVFRFEE